MGYGAIDGSILLSEETGILSDDDTFESRGIEGTIMLKQVVDTAKAKELLFKGNCVLKLNHTRHSFCPSPMASSCPTSYDSYVATTDKDKLALKKEEWETLIGEA